MSDSNPYLRSSERTTSHRAELTLLCHRADLDAPEITQLRALIRAVRLDHEVGLLDEHDPQQLVRATVSGRGRRLVVLCKTPGLSVTTRLQVKHAFIAHAQCDQWLTTARLEDGVEAVWSTLLETSCTLFAQVPRLRPLPTCSAYPRPRGAMSDGVRSSQG